MSDPGARARMTERDRKEAVLKTAASLALLLTAILPVPLQAQKTLFFLELQAVGAYWTAANDVQLFSLMPDDAMQKPSLGFDLVRRFSGRSRDIGLLAVQARLAYDEQGESKLEPQLYNAFFRLKTRSVNIWAGHNRPALGLSSVLDSHALLLPAPAMLGYGFDRDWGIGIERDLPSGGLAISLTTGSGMPLYLKGNFLVAARFFKGVLARDNYSVGVSLAHGDILETMGTTLLSDEPFAWTAASLDLTHLWRNLENRMEVQIGRRDDAGAFLFFWRAGLGLLDESRLKLEVQPVLKRSLGIWDTSLGLGLTYLFNADLAGRFMILDDSERRGARLVVQLYFYKGL